MTTCSTPPCCAAAGRRWSPPPGARSRPPPAICCSRARSRSWPAAGASTRCGCCRTRRRRWSQGELLQREDAWRLETTRERYLRRCDLKTARLFRAACELGALGRAGGGNVAVCWAEFGERIGLAFQLLDDVLDVSGPAERTGKHRGTDLLDGTVTLPLILARERDPELARLDLRAVRTPEQAENVCDAIAATGALQAAREEALAMVAEAKAGLPALAGTVATGCSGAGGRRRRRPLQLKVFRQDRVGVQGGGEAVGLGLHVRLHEPAQVLDERLGAQVQLLVELVDGRLVELADLATTRSSGSAARPPSASRRPPPNPPGRPGRGRTRGRCSDRRRHAAASRRGRRPRPRAARSRRPRSSGPRAGSRGGCTDRWSWWAGS